MMVCFPAGRSLFRLQALLKAGICLLLWNPQHLVQCPLPRWPSENVLSILPLSTWGQHTQRQTHLCGSAWTLEGQPPKSNPKVKGKVHIGLCLHPPGRWDPLYLQFAPSSGDSVEGSGPIADVGRLPLGTLGLFLSIYLHLELKTQ